MQNIGLLGIIAGLLIRFWPVWLALAVLLSLSFLYRRRLGLYGHVINSGVGFAGASGFNGGVQSEKIGLPRDFLHDADFLRDRTHGVDSAVHRLAAGFSVLGGLARDLFRLRRVIGVLLDVCGHLFHRGRGLLGRRSLFGRAGGEGPPAHAEDGRRVGRRGW